jgi:glutamyl-tRNA synthetase
MSKREAAELNNDGYSIFIKDLEQLGYLPEAVINWVSLMGWSYDDHTEFFTLNDLVEKFSLDKLNPSPAAINFSKLDYFNKEHIKVLSDKDLASRIQPFFVKQGYEVDMKDLITIAPVLKERITTLDDSVELCAFLFKDAITHERESLLIKGKSADETKCYGMESLRIIENLPEFKPTELEAAFTEYMTAQGLTPRELLSFLREAISGQRITPPLFECMQVLGKEKTIQRLKDALELI